MRITKIRIQIKRAAHRIIFWLAAKAEAAPVETVEDFIRNKEG